MCGLFTFLLSVPTETTVCASGVKTQDLPLFMDPEREGRHWCSYEESEINKSTNYLINNLNTFKIIVGKIRDHVRASAITQVSTSMRKYVPSYWLIPISWLIICWKGKEHTSQKLIYLACAHIHWSIIATPPSLRSSKSSVDSSNRTISGNNLFSSLSSTRLQSSHKFVALILLTTY